MSLNQRLAAFLTSSFISTVGDTLLVFAVPVGLGLETKDLRSAVLMWLIPAIAMFSSSFLHAQIKNRHKTARSDYAYLLLGIAALEIIISILAFTFKTPMATVLLITTFVFGYALAKEGIPRLLYAVSIYRYFADDASYRRVAGINAALGIIAALMGTILAAFIVRHGNWRIALMIDASTFVVFGACILFFGRDPQQKPTVIEPEKPPVDNKLQSDLKFVYIFVPLIFGINALIWNYLPLLSDHFGVANVFTSIILIAFVRLPGLISGFFIEKISRIIPTEKIIRVIPTLFISTSFLFVLMPSTLTLVLGVLVQGVLAGIYWPSDYSLRNKLGHSELIQFNTSVLRRLAAFQFLACCLAIVVFSPNTNLIRYMPALIALLSILSWVLASGFQVPSLKRVLILATTVTVIGYGCMQNTKSQVTRIIFPPVSRNLELRSDLTYAAMTILNETSAHLVSVSQDLTLQPELLKHFDRLDGGRKYVLDLNETYRSARDERITAEDIAFTLRYYLSQQKEIAGSLKYISGSKKCISLDCNLKGLKVESAFRLTLTLSTPDLRFVEFLTSPWIVILKKGKPLVEKIGDCVVPYQTGLGIITKCDSSGVAMRIKSRDVLISEHEPESKNEVVARLLMDNPKTDTPPTLSILSAYANPTSKNLNRNQRITLVTTIRAHAKEIAKSVKLKWSPLLAPRWLGERPPVNLQKISAPQSISCPKEPVKILLETSMPYLGILRNELSKIIPCPTTISITTGNQYFAELAKSDIALAWFTPDFLDLYNMFFMFDCSSGNLCYFNWKDQLLQSKVNKLRLASAERSKDTNTSLAIEEHIYEQGYAAPIAEIAWWIQTPTETKPIHPAGLFLVRAGDFL